MEILLNVYIWLVIMLIVNGNSFNFETHRWLETNLHWVTDFTLLMFIIIIISFIRIFFYHVTHKISKWLSFYIMFILLSFIYFYQCQLLDQIMNQNWLWDNLETFISLSLFLPGNSLIIEDQILTHTQRIDYSFNRKSITWILWTYTLYINPLFLELGSFFFPYFVSLFSIFFSLHGDSYSESLELKLSPKTINTQLNLNLIGNPIDNL